MFEVQVYTRRPLGGCCLDPEGLVDPTPPVATGLGTLSHGSPWSLGACEDALLRLYSRRPDRSKDQVKIVGQDRSNR